MNTLELLVICTFAFCLTNVYAGFINPFQVGYRDRTLPSRTTIKEDLPPDYWFTQRLDHFNDADTRTWQQRYYMNNKSYVPDGPVFVLIGGESDLLPEWIEIGQWVNWAKEFGALCLFLEHRYYGDSHPTEDLSLKNMQYLSTAQVLGDVATFQMAMIERYGLHKAKWVYFGGSYSGSLAAWFRLKYPHLADGAVASSAPVLAKVNYKEIYLIAQSSIDDISSTCNSAILTAVKQINFLLTKKNGPAILTTKFRLCTPLNISDADEVANMHSYLSGNIIGIVQYNRNSEPFDGSSPTNATIEGICSIMNNSTIGRELDRYALINSKLLQYKRSRCLHQSYKEMVEDFRRIEWSYPTNKDGSRQWHYQSCTAFGWQKSAEIDHPFGQDTPLSFYVKQCTDVFGSKFNQTSMEAGVNHTNTLYGGKNIQVNKLVIYNGGLDPWQDLGVVEDKGNGPTVLFVKNASHCADMIESTPLDEPEILEVRRIIRQEIKKWIGIDDQLKSPNKTAANQTKWPTAQKSDLKL